MRKILFVLSILAFVNISDCLAFEYSNKTSASINGGSDPRKMKKRKIRKQFNRAIEFFYQQQYDKSLALFKKMAKKDPERPNLNFFIGVNMLKLNKSKSETRTFFEKAVRLTVPNYIEKFDENRAPAFAYYYLAQVYLSQNLFDEAINNALLFRSFIPVSNSSLLKEVNQLIVSCHVAKALYQNPDKNVDIKPLDVLNTSFTDFGAQFSADGNQMFFSSRRNFSSNVNEKDLDGQYKSDIYYVTKNGQSWSSPTKINIACKDEANDNFCCLSIDGNYMFFSSDREQEQYDIYYCLKMLDGSWSEPRRLGENINSYSSNETYAWLSLNWQTLYIVSDKKGGFGGRDIYFSKKMENSDWQKMENMGGVINTEFDEKSPYVSEDGKQLFFSSRGHLTSGGFDIFYSENLDSTWTTSVNVGYPINTVFDDHYFVQSPDKKYAVYSSAKKGMESVQDMYMISGFNNGLISANKAILDNLKFADGAPNRKYLMAKDDKIKYTVQVGAGVKMQISSFNVLYGVKACTGKDALKRFIIGEFDNKEDAVKMKEEIIQLGFTDAWTPIIDENRYDCE
ncbi:MAG: hypothetical protein WCK02_02340 [Bacteroidota bacterium]